MTGTFRIVSGSDPKHLDPGPDLIENSALRRADATDLASSASATSAAASLGYRRTALLALTRNTTSTARVFGMPRVTTAACSARRVDAWPAP